MRETAGAERGGDAWTSPPDRAERPEPGDAEHLRRVIAEGRTQIEAGQGIPADQAEKDLGIERGSSAPAGA